MIKCVYVNGCSFARGQGLTDGKSVKEVLYEFTEYKKTHTYGGLIASHLNSEYINNALPGGSNDRMLRTTIEDIAKLLKTYKKDEILVLLCFTEGSRTEFYDTKYRYCPYMDTWKNEITKSYCELWDIYTAYFNHAIEHVDKSFSQILSLQSFLKSQGIAYLFSEAMHTIPHDSDSVYKCSNMFSLETTDHIKNDCRYSLIDLSYCVEHSFMHYTKNVYTLPYSKCLHPLEEAHKVFAEYQLTTLKERGII